MEIVEGSLASIILFFIALGFCAMFSFLETSITALRLFKLKELAQKIGLYREIFDSLENNPTRLLNTILVANTLASTTAATAGTFVIDQLLDSLPNSISFALSILTVTAALLIFGEIIPKNIAKVHGEKFFTSTLWITNIFFYALYPFVTILAKMSNNIIGKLIGLEPTASGFITSEKEIKFLIDYIDEKGLMEREKTSMLRSVFELGKTPVKEIMVPATKIISIGVHKIIPDAYELFNTHQFSRIPVYDGKVNNIIGMLHFKDLAPLIAGNKDRPLKEILRPILFIPESVKVNQLLKEFKTQQMHIAMIINEHGGIIGLVTLEDILEEIVGEIHDEYEAVTPKAIPLKPSGWLIDASIDLEQLEKILKTNFKTDTARTLGGFVTEQFQHLPKKGEQLRYHNYTFQIQQANSKKILQVLVFKNQNGD